ncbi:hypothetical protein QW180_22715 [Vibrio sinaloensis]|nr:hypothetical protein [Vibrio sinaloensis]
MLAVDVPIMDMERFDNANPLQVRTQELIKRVDDLLPTVFFLRGKEKSDGGCRSA